jgi:aryl-alcohol dehydrogenase-like predicted oxidoreductase
MGLEGCYGASDDAQGRAAIRRALDLGMAMIDTADAYGAGNNETRVGEEIRAARAHAFIATKFGVVYEQADEGRDFPTGWGFALKVNGSPSYADRALNKSLKRLNADHIDLWYLHYPDPAVPIEETVSAMAQAVKSGKARHLGLSNVTAAQVERAHRVHPIAAVQYEYSLWRREAESELLPTLRKLGIALVAWAPLGSGFLSGQIEGVSKDDARNYSPRFSGENLQTNLQRFAPLVSIARELEVTPAQLALAWLLHQGTDIIPIPGTRHAARVDENAAAAGLALDQSLLRRIDALARVGLAQGANML